MIPATTVLPLVRESEYFFPVRGVPPALAAALVTGKESRS
jgi:hypothetical protein